MEEEISQERLDRAKARLISRYPDRDAAENAVMFGKKIYHAPFTKQELKYFNQLQKANPQGYGFSCGKCKEPRLLYAREDGFKCCWCGWDQPWFIGGNDGL